MSGSKISPEKSNVFINIMEANLKNNENSKKIIKNKSNTEKNTTKSNFSNKGYENLIDKYGYEKKLSRKVLKKVQVLDTKYIDFILEAGILLNMNLSKNLNKKPFVNELD